MCFGTKSPQTSSVWNSVEVFEKTRHHNGRRSYNQNKALLSLPFVFLIYFVNAFLNLFKNVNFIPSVFET